MNRDQESLHRAKQDEKSEQNMQDRRSEFKVRMVSQLSAISAEEWDRCLGEKGSPFLRYHFLQGLELSGCVGAHTGWLPRYLLIERFGTLIGAASAYVKSHSQGEFIFDWSWADAAHRADPTACRPRAHLRVER